MTQRKGRASIEFERPPYIIGEAAIVGSKEGDGPLGHLFDRIEEDPSFGKNTWEEAESELQLQTARKAMEKAGMNEEQVRYLFDGDLLAQGIATSYGIMELQIPLFGLYGACSTSGESLGLCAMAVNAGYANCAMALTSSHFASAEKEFRFPLEYAGQRPLSTTWTVTGAGAFILADSSRSVVKTSAVRVAGITTGKIVDYGVKDSMHMGAAMAPAAADTICQHLRDFGRTVEDYDRIITGDLGSIGQNILKDLLLEKEIDLGDRHEDCGMLIYDPETQDTHAGGSGCGCAASTLAAYILPKLKSGEWKRVLFVPTGALMSRVSFNEGQSIPGIAHGVVLEHVPPSDRT
jgi:stage V sporulation protein AD